MRKPEPQSETVRGREERPYTGEKEREKEKVQQHDDTQLGQSGKILNEKLEGTPNPERP